MVGKVEVEVRQLGVVGSGGHDAEPPVDQPVLQGKPALLFLKGVHHCQQNPLVQNQLTKQLERFGGF